MKELLNENTLVATVLMYLEAQSSLLVVVEGHDDHLALKSHLSNDLDLLVGNGGREAVLRAAKIAHDQGLDRVRFLVDRDFDDFQPPALNTSANPLVIRSTNHDIFMDVVASDPGILRRITDVHASHLARNGKGPVDPVKIIDRAFHLTHFVTAVRIVSLRRGYGLTLRDFPFGNLPMPEDATLERVCDLSVERTQDAPIDAVSLAAECQSVFECLNKRKFPATGDHDAFSALSRSLKHEGATVSRSMLQRSFIIGITCDSLINTSWFERLEAWAHSHALSGFTCRQRLGHTVA